MPCKDTACPYNLIKKKLQHVGFKAGVKTENTQLSFSIDKIILYTRKL